MAAQSARHHSPPLHASSLPTAQSPNLEPCRTQPPEPRQRNQTRPRSPCSFCSRPSGLSSFASRFVAYGPRHLTLASPWPLALGPCLSRPCDTITSTLHPRPAPSAWTPTSRSFMLASPAHRMQNLQPSSPSATPALQPYGPTALQPYGPPALQPSSPPTLKPGSRCPGSWKSKRVLNGGLARFVPLSLLVLISSSSSSSSNSTSSLTLTS